MQFVGCRREKKKHVDVFLLKGGKNVAFGNERFVFSL